MDVPIDTSGNVPYLNVLVPWPCGQEVLVVTKTTAGDDIDVTPEDNQTNIHGADQTVNKITSMDGMIK